MLPISTTGRSYRGNLDLDIITKILRSLTDPIVATILKSSWWVRLLVLVALVTVFLGFQYPEKGLNLASLAFNSVRILTAPSGKIPVSESAKDRLSNLINTLTVNLTADILDKSQGEEFGFTAWPIAQMSVALRDNDAFDKKDIGNFLLKKLDLNCSCWRETAGKAPHVAASAWVLYAFGLLDLPHVAEAEDFLIGNQKFGGWWPLHPSTLQKKNASTYATVWAIFALNEHVKYGHFTGDNKNKINEIITKGLSWIRKNKIENQARWYDYPNNTKRIESVSVSGLVLNLLHEIYSDKELKEIDQQWLNDLEYSLTSASEAEISDVYIQLETGDLDFDKTRHYKLPWALMATTDAYFNGSLLQKAKALRWIERIIRAELADSSVLAHNWIAAELLISLKHLSKSIQ